VAFDGVVVTVKEWVQDCWNDSYGGAPTDGRPWVVVGSVYPYKITGPHFVRQ